MVAISGTSPVNVHEYSIRYSTEYLSSEKLDSHNPIQQNLFASSQQRK